MFAAVLVAQVSPAERIVNTVPDVARPLPLTAVRLTGGPLKHAQDLDADYLLKLEPDRMLAFYRKRAGLPPKARAVRRLGRRRTQAHRPHRRPLPVRRQPDVGRDRRRALQAARRLHRQRAEGWCRTSTATAISARSRGGEEAFADVAKGNIRSGGFDLNGLWSPWYTLHKTFAGLRDAYRYTGNRTALDVEIKFAGVGRSASSRRSTTRRCSRCSNTEFGGMNEVLADLYADTGDRRWLDSVVHVRAPRGARSAEARTRTA